MWTEKQKKDTYEILLLQQQGLLEAEDNWLANLANSSALLNETLPETVFAGSEGSEKICQKEKVQGKWELFLQ
ncbi:hypothetical protein EfmAA290_17250 [Enterococcus faecium]|nr:hypothetical protein EfmAA290_17250 [Enterococcus faecium]